MVEGEFYNIEKILERRVVNGKFQYKIKWEGYPMSQCTWDPLKNLESVKELVEEFDFLHPITPTQKPIKSVVNKKDNTFTKKKKKRRKK